MPKKIDSKSSQASLSLFMNSSSTWKVCKAVSIKETFHFIKIWNQEDLNIKLFNSFKVLKDGQKDFVICFASNWFWESPKGQS